MVLGPMDEGSRTGLQFSCCGHIAEILVKLLTDTVHRDDSRHTMSSSRHGRRENIGFGNLPPISKIDAFGIKNLAVDVAAFELFAGKTGVPQLSESFQEIKSLTSALLDKDLPNLMLTENRNERRKRYPFLSLEKLANTLEKYVGVGISGKLAGATGRHVDMLMLEKKEVNHLLKLARMQAHN